jgi:hypothetical protein
MNAARGLGFISRAHWHSGGKLGPEFAAAPAPFVDALMLYAQGSLYEQASRVTSTDDVRETES